MPSTPTDQTSTVATAAPALPQPAAALCRAVASGRADAITALYRARFGLVLATARRITGRDESFGLDAAQETFLRVIKASAALRRIASDTDLDRWLVRLTHSACIDLLRREQRRTRRERSAAASVEMTAKPDAARDIERLTRLLAELDAEDRALLGLRTSGLTLETLARIFGISPGAAHGRVRRTTQTLARGMKEPDHDQP